MYTGAMYTGAMYTGAMYEGDSFFTLGVAGQAGLAVLSAVMALALCLSAGVLARRFRQLWRGVLVAPGLFWIFLWLSPQVYYGYYLLIFDGLPLQIVIGWLPPNATTVLDLILFRERETLSAHGKGALFWAMLATAIVSWQRARWRAAPRRPRD